MKKKFILDFILSQSTIPNFELCTMVSEYLDKYYLSNFLHELSMERRYKMKKYQKAILTSPISDFIKFLLNHPQEVEFPSSRISFPRFLKYFSKPAQVSHIPWIE